MTPALKGHLAMLCFSGLVAGSFALGSMAAQHIAPAALNAPRFLLA
ncbi:MAG: EamA family transporter, partial [Roseovarius sp.]